MNLRGVSAIIAAMLIFTAVVISQPTAPTLTIQWYVSSSQLAALGGATSDSSGSSVSTCEKSGSDKADGMCPTPIPSKTGYKAGAGKTYFDGLALVENLYGLSCSDQYVSGICCGPKSCMAQKCIGADGQTTACQAEKMQEATANAAGSNGKLSDAPQPGVKPDTPLTTTAPAQTPSANASTNSQTTGSAAVQRPASGGQTAQTTPGSAQIQGAQTSAGGTSSQPPATTPGYAPTAAAPSSNAPSTLTFSGSPSLNNISTPANPMTYPFPSSSPIPNQTQTSYTPTAPTFGGRGGVSSNSAISPTVTANSPFTNLFSSVGNLGSFFNSVVSVFAPSYTAPAPVQINQIVQENPAGSVVSSVVAGSNAQVSPDSFSETGLSQGASWQQQPDAYLHLITGDQHVLSPADIATIVQGSSGGGNPAEAVIGQASGGSLIQSLLEQEPASLSENSTINLQVPQITSLALNTVNGLENYQNVPEQFYIEEAQLAQAQSNYAWLQAQIEAWANAQQAGVCDSACQNALTTLESELPEQSRHVHDLQAQVDAGPEAVASSSVATSVSSTTEPTLPTPAAEVPGAGQTQVVAAESSTLQTPVPSEGAPYYVKQNDEWCDQYDQCIPASAFQPEPVSQVINANTVFTGATTTVPTPLDPVAAIAHAVQSWVNDIVSLVTPNAASSTSSVQSCSLFKSLFGGCGGGW